MESLALTVSLIVFPAMFGGPLALILTFLPFVQRKRIAQFLVTYLAILSIIVGGYLLLLNVSRGGTLIGITGLVTGVLALMRIRRSRKDN
jgi:ABC-type tungstate transport system substrate-binding protein